MKYLYNFAINILGIIIPVLAIFNQKLALFVKGRKETIPRLLASIKPDDKTIWMHCASLGEFEQGRPLLESLRKSNPDFKIVLSFYSPSGYEIRKDYQGADIVVYLPIDTLTKSRKFIELIHPSLAIFVKYEFWPNMLSVLKEQSIKTILVSGIFRNDQIFFKSYGGWMRNSLDSFSHFFVQNDSSKLLIEKIGFSNVTISGDTRFDRVANILHQNNKLDFLEDFVKDSIVMVAGSTWPIDENYLVNFINQNSLANTKFIIAPHNIKPKEVQKLKKEINCIATLYSEGQIKEGAKVFIADTIGILTKIYSYADIAYVGGGFDKEGIHNILEPAVFGIPLIIGPIYDKFEEAKELVSLQGCLVAKNESDLHKQLNQLFINTKYREDLGIITEKYIKTHLGATKIILDYIEHQLEDIS